MNYFGWKVKYVKEPWKITQLGKIGCGHILDSLKIQAALQTALNLELWTQNFGGFLQWSEMNKKALKALFKKSYLLR